MHEFLSRSDNIFITAKLTEHLLRFVSVINIKTQTGL